MKTVKWHTQEYHVLGHNWYARHVERTGTWRLYYGTNAKGSDVPGYLKAFREGGELVALPTLAACREYVQLRARPAKAGR